MLTPEQHAIRARTLGASEVAAAIGLNPYTTPWEVWARKRGLVPPLAETPAMRMGNILEDAVIRLYSLDHAEPEGHFVWRADDDAARAFNDERQLARKARLEHVEATFVRDGWMSATPDAFRVIPGDGGGMLDDQTTVCLVECKTTNLRGGAAWADGAAPQHYVIQAQWQMHVLGVDRVDLACLIAGQTLAVRTIPRDDLAIAEIVRRATAFWQHVTDGTEPPKPYGTDAFTEHLARTYPKATDGMLPTTEYVTDVVARFVAARDAEGAARKTKEAAADELREIIGAARGIGDLDTDGYRATWTEQAGKTDYKALALSLGATPEQIKDHTAAPSRVLRVRTKGEE